MSVHRISVSRTIAAPAKRLYAIIGDYANRHESILPKPPFVSLTVTKGGFGAGTEFDLVMRFLGRRTRFRGVVSEPDPGRVIAERYLDTDIVTTFTIAARDGGRAADVTIATDLDLGSGVLGAMRRWLAGWLLQPVYVAELAQLEAVAAQTAD